MYLDAAEYLRFYASRRGAAVRRLLAHRIQARWRNLDDKVIIGSGYATPYLGVYREKAAAVGAIMPAAQGVVPWPTTGPKCSLLVDDQHLALPDASVDYLLAVHCLEMCENPSATLRDLWRILKPEGRMLMIVPNRRGIWARLDTTPFGYGRPYSRGQLQTLLMETLFEPIHWSGALNGPPIPSRLFLRSIVAWERIGARMWPAFSGLIIVEATKILTAPIGLVQARRIPARIVAAHTGRHSRQQVDPADDGQ